MCEKTEQICEGQGWEVITCDDGRLIVATTGDIVCHQDPNHATGDETDAKRFNIIAAAPAMLAALREMEVADDIGSVAKALQSGRDAIAKAEGRS